jgi:hypothetical protein
MCGPSSEQRRLEAQQASFATLMQNDYVQRFGQQSAVLQQLNNILTPIAEAGPSQQGMSGQELAALNTAAMVNTSNATRNAQEAARTAMAGQGGGAASPLTSGIEQQISGSIASRGAQQLAGLQTGITQENYALGRQQWQQAMGGLQALGSQYNPVDYGKLGADTNESAFGEATQIRQMENQAEADIAGSIAGIGMDALTFGAGGLAAPKGSGIGGFFKAGIEALGNPGG